MENYLFVIPFIAWFLVQCLKMCIDFHKTKKFSFVLFWASWWFPSVHSALSSSVSTLIALHEGIHSSLFALAIVLSFLFWYDAMNVRYESGKHARYLNTMRRELKDVLVSSEEAAWDYLKERIGHTPYEVMGWIFFGVCITILLYYAFVAI